MPMPPHGIDTKDSNAVAARVQAVFTSLGWNDSAPLLQLLFSDVTRMFSGRWPGYLAIDMRYHDFEHTLQATVCLADLLLGRARDGAQPVFSRREAELSVMAVLLHDTGYLKTTRDPEGTGAKYTLVHVQRSCEFAQRYLPALGVSPSEIEDACSAIHCTGPRNKIGAQKFRHPVAQLMACLLVTADYLGQMSAPDYPEELEILFWEFEEAYNYEGVPPLERPFKSVADLVARTPVFWENFVRPMLDTEAGGVHQHLFTGQTNPYLLAVETNIAEIRRRSTSGVVHA